MGTTVIKSYAKINICLNVVGKRKDGYHELDMIMLPIDLHDTILLSKEKANAKNHFITIDDFSITSQQYNTVTSAIEKLQDIYKFPDLFRVFVHKNIPIQAGLGGGSSNAAFTVKAINKLLGLNASDQELKELCESLGGDVPFFIDCKPCRCKGIGEDCTPIEVKNNYYVLIIKPRKGCSTKEVYVAGDEMKLDVYDIDKVIECLKNGDDDELVKYIGNALEKPALTFVPEIAELEQKLKDFGFKIVMMSGSGSAVFAMSTDESLVNNAFKTIEGNFQVIKTKVLK
ncbi:MAG: 4-(cytidine 5'-diphospho)-2-C-methyl-D-erythritol kinase [Bacilli bacterium]|nr:4-(cytidine 5'-diphospho)-2-C-methyl-D-erythritol kinase [Bacilli bacterium]